MAYVALYRKWRPTGFGAVRGQDAVVATLKNQIISDRVGHAYLFCGSRGTGKTTVAKIFAKAVNCENVKDGEPCGTCAMCRAIDAGSSTNVIEIDAASNNGVDNIREIREEVQYRPAEGKYRVYIIDEAHAITPAAFNALLKTLEEPPSYVIFILATTEPHRILPTVLSRCQRYDFRRITTQDIIDRLKELAEGEGAQADAAALGYIARKADGGLRDAISLFDQCLSACGKERLTYEKALAALGTVDSDILSRLLRALLADDTSEALNVVEEVRNAGGDLGQFVQDFIWYLRNLLLLMCAEASNDLLEMSETDWMRLAEEARMTEPDELMRYIRLFSALYNDMRGAADKRVLLEVAVIKATRPAMEEDLSALTGRIAQLERKVEKLPAQMAQAPAKIQPAAAPAPEAPKKKLDRARWEDLQLLQENWNEVLRGMPYQASLPLKNVWLSPREEGVMELVFPDPFAKNTAEKFRSLEQLGETVEKRYGKVFRFDGRVAGRKESKPVFVPDSELAAIRMPIEWED